MKNFIYCLLMSSFSLFATLPEPYCSTKDLSFDPGPLVFINHQQIARLLEKKQVMIAIEVGSFLGQSTRFIASHLPPGGKIYAVDTWLGTTTEPWMLQDNRKAYFYQLFLSNVKHDGLADIIVPIRMESGEAASALNLMADLIYIDADHAEEAVYRDILLWYPHLAPGGIFCGDDWNWGGVRLGVQRAAKELDKTIVDEGNFWRFL